MGSELEADIIEKSIQATVGLGDYKKQGMENKGISDDDFVTQEKRGEEARRERITTTKKTKTGREAS
ncbi:hypothetical protein PanWU01x14_231030 [Parasponia andersonii]|uniref:Uncharacterized protein n=1 Tax=Parasponia andersonii TaxID=3476 RepID=A0A2P5BKL9_PARAD|nr:hypothetical protein PanWU01x14_231030 [Parasponia andersonii]